MEVECADGRDGHDSEGHAREGIESLRIHARKQHAELIADTLDAPFEHMIDTQRVGNLPGREILSVSANNKRIASMF